MGIHPAVPYVFAESKQDQTRDLLRLSTAGSVDDGKSTLIGRLLYDSRSVYEDQVAAVSNRTVNGVTGAVDFALLTDGLRVEREQGITIDVAYRYFSTPKRKFIIADTPGHEQYTRNMATGASTANLAIILVDARKGILPQSRRHAFIASLLGVRHLVVAVNKMDLVDFSEASFNKIRDDFTAFAPELDITDVHFIPVSALEGDNVVAMSARMPWFEGHSLLRYLEDVHIANDRNLREMRFPVQLVIRPNLDFRGFAGEVVSGVIRPGDKVVVLPSGRTSTVKSIVTRDGDLLRAFAPMSVTLCLDDDVDISRGDMLVHPGHTPRVTRLLDARLVWMATATLKTGRPYLIKHLTHSVKAIFRSIRFRIDVNTLERQQVKELGLNDIGSVVVETTSPVFVDPYRRNRATGSFIVIDLISNETVAAGMITGREVDDGSLAMNRGEGEPVSPIERIERYGHSAAIIFLNDAAAAQMLEQKLFGAGCRVVRLDAKRYGDQLTTVAGAMLEAGLLVVCQAPAGYTPPLEHLRASGDVITTDDDKRGGDAVSHASSTLISRGVVGQDVL
jgi:sulfate adenylyltransferase large subunit